MNDHHSGWETFCDEGTSIGGDHVELEVKLSRLEDKPDSVDYAFHIRIAKHGGGLGYSLTEIEGLLLMKGYQKQSNGLTISTTCGFVTCYLKRGLHIPDLRDWRAMVREELAEFVM